MVAQKIQMAAAGAAGASGGARQQNPPAKAAASPAKIKEWYTVVIYEKRRVSTVVLYVGREAFTFKLPARISVGGVIMKKWKVGSAVGYSARIHAASLAMLIDSYAHGEAVRKISLLDPVYRAAALNGYKVHGNELYVKLWLEHKLGEELFHTGDPRERELGECIKHFTHSYGIWRMVTPPWAATC
jgi:hypothetical protein